MSSPFLALVLFRTHVILLRSDSRVYDVELAALFSNIVERSRNRLQQELMGIMMGADPGASAFPVEDNLFEWTATLSGSEDTVVRKRVHF